MTGQTLECLQSYAEFQSIRDDWDAFINRSFPEHYARTHAWLSAYWETHHPGQTALIYIQRDADHGRIVAAAPLVIKQENFGGFRVRMLQTLGSGLGSDDFLMGTESKQTVRAVFSHLQSVRTWDVSLFRRVTLERFRDDLSAISAALNCRADVSNSPESSVLLPDTYEAYLASRSSKFRNNLKNAIKKLEQQGSLSVELLSPFTQAERALALCEEVARKSWQFKSGKSHFNRTATASFYENLCRTGKGAGGEEFVVLLLDEKPVAFLLGCKRGRCYHLVDTAYDEEFSAVSVGRVLFCKTIERLINSGDIDRFSLEGDGRYKDFFANETETAHLIVLYHGSLYGRCIGFIRKTPLYGFLKKLKTPATR